MLLNKAFIGPIAAAALLGTAAPSCHAFDSLSAEFASGNRTQAVRIGAQWKWQARWLSFHGMHIGGYWDLDLAGWHGNRFRNMPGETQNLAEIGITPVFRLQSDSGRGPYLEAGIGAHLLSRQYDNNGRVLSTRFQFGDHIGAGYQFTNRLDIGIRFQHFSNGGIKEPNNGVNFTGVRVSYGF